MLTTGWTNKTPWNTPREYPEEAIARRLDDLAAGLANPAGALFNVHVPPYDSRLDTAPLLGQDLKVKTSMGGEVTAPVRIDGEDFAPLTGADFALTQEEFERVFNAGARPQRLLWASTGTKDPEASDILYIKALAAPFTVNTMPEGTLKALADHGGVGQTMPTDGGDSEQEFSQFAAAGIDVRALSNRLQDEGAKSFVSSWNDLMGVISSKSAVLKRAS